jgi:hypothetical protein
MDDGSDCSVLLGDGLCAGRDEGRSAQNRAQVCAAQHVLRLIWDDKWSDLSRVWKSNVSLAEIRNMSSTCLMVSLFAGALLISVHSKI